MDGMFGLEKEGLRVWGDGTFSHTRHPFMDDGFIVRDFCENQTEINTGVHTTAEAAIQELQEYDGMIQKTVFDLPVREYIFVEKGVWGRDVFMGLASVRCSELGYWNDFVPVFDYQSMEAYADSIGKYVLQGLLKTPSELYYPVRLKPTGENHLENLKRNGVSHIELRMFTSREFWILNMLNLRMQTTVMHGRLGKCFRAGLSGKAWNWQRGGRKSVSSNSKGLEGFHRKGWIRRWWNGKGHLEKRVTSLENGNYQGYAVYLAERLAKVK